MSRLRVIFDLLAERWEIAVANIDLVTMPQPRGDNVFVGYGPDGNVIEIIVDALALPAIAIDEIATAFGNDAAAAIQALEPTSDLEVVIETDGDGSDVGAPTTLLPDTTTSVPADTTSTDTTSTDTMPTGTTATTPTARPEPGIPIAQPDGSFEVPGAIGTGGGRRIDSVTLRVDDGALTIDMPPLAAGEELWIRVSAAQSGTLLAIGPVRPDAETANLAFGLEIPPEHLHIRIDSDPLIPVGTRRQRRSSWVDQLLDRASSRTWTRPGASKKDAATAQAVADELGDRSRAERAAALGRRATTARWIRRATIAAVLVAAGAVGWALVSGSSEPANDLRPEPAPEIIAPTTEPYVETRPASIGPATFTYGDAGSVRAIVQGSTANVEPGETIQLGINGISEWLWDYAGFDPDLSVEENTLLARDNCLRAVRVPVGPYIGFPVDMTLRLAKLGPDQTAQDIIAGETPAAGMFLATEPMNREIEYTTSIAESCEAGRLDADRKFIADTLLTRMPQTVEVTIPERTPPGLWMLLIDAPTTPVGTLGSILLRID